MNSIDTFLLSESFMPSLTLEDVVRFSPFVARSLSAMHPGEDARACLAHFERIVEETFPREAMEAEAAAAADSQTLRMKLREMRRRLIVNIIGRNATGRIDYFEVVRLMSDFAETAVTATVKVNARELAERCGVPYGMSGRPQDLMVVGMGKLGGRELNVSSDIDLIFLFDEEGETRATPEFPNARRTLTVQEFYERLARRVIPALNDIEGPGFVFRVDMRLRPNGESGPIVCSTDMLEEYLYTQGRDWERFAWLKGRIINEPVFSAPEDFEQQKRNVSSLVRPFVFRKYLDFNAISSLTRLHEMIRAETARRELARGGTCINVKLGRGGIREIEFLTQTLQVIRGGRDPLLRGRETLAMLEVLSGDGGISAEMAARLSEHYVFLRNVEHAIQYVNDEQTQRLPKEGEGLTAVAGLLGMPADELWSRLEGVREYVAAAFDSVFQVHEPAADTADWPTGWETGTSSASEALTGKLRSLGYGDDVDELVSRIMRLASARAGRSLSDEARKRLQSLIPVVAEGCPEWLPKDGPRVVPAVEVFSRYLKLLEAIAGRSTYVALLSQYPKAAERVGRVLAASRWTADYIVRHPIILDELVDGRIHEMDDFTPVDWSEWADRLHRALVEADGDQERQMNALRDAHHSAVFRLLIADLDGRFTVERLADHLSALADAVLEEVLDLAWVSMTKKHCDRPKFAVIGYGKLGGKELGYDSDLDLVFIYDDPDLEADLTYSRLVRRMMSWLTIQTSSGKLFDVDLRLRPNGDSGLIVSSFDMFSRYQRNADGNGAWFWEHQSEALTGKLRSLGYGDDVDELVSRIMRLASARAGRSLSDEARKRLQSLIPVVAEGCPEWLPKDGPRVVPAVEVFSRYLKLLEAIAGRSTYVALLSQYPKAAERVGRVLAASRWTADYIVRHPIILDELVDGRIHEMDDFTPVDWSEWADRLHRALVEADGDQERQMNALRDAHHSAVFRLLIADLDGRFTVERLADHLSALADAVLEEVLDLAWVSMTKKHCDRPKFAVIGYGKLGGKELGYDSDLDLVFIYDDPDLEADLTYSRLVRRMMSWLTIQTSSGKLFDVDLRLRPNGDSGLIVSSFDMFSRYQRNADGNGAWFWEHQALTRARFVAGDADVGKRFEDERREILMMPRTQDEARASVLEMRRKMLDGHPNRTALFDIKHDRGGMVDVEFIVQLLVLTHSAEHPELVNNFGNILLLEKAADLGLTDPAVSAPAVRAYRRYRALQHEIRLNAGEGVPVRVPADMIEAEREAVLKLWRTVFETDAPLREGDTSDRSETR